MRDAYGHRSGHRWRASRDATLVWRPSPNLPRILSWQAFGSAQTGERIKTLGGQGGQSPHWSATAAREPRPAECWLRLIHESPRPFGLEVQLKAKRDEVGAMIFLKHRVRAA